MRVKPTREDAGCQSRSRISLRQAPLLALHLLVFRLGGFDHGHGAVLLQCGPDEGLPHDLLWYQLALTLDSLGRDGEAKEAYLRIVEDFPQSAYAATARQRSGGAQTPLFGG